MPNFDKTGPAGEGPATGQGFGDCVENQTSNQPIFGRGNGRMFGRGNGGGRGCNRRGFQNVALSLEDQEKLLENRLEAIRKLKKDSN